jgi:hypothetical protein
MAEIVDVVLVDAGANATGVILALRAVTAKEPVLEMVDLQMARRFVDNPPCVVGPNVPCLGSASPPRSSPCARRVLCG